MNDDVTNYIRMFNQFFSKGQMSSTYKPVFLRSLLDLGKYNIHGSNNGLVGNQWIQVDGDTVTLDLNFIATRFIKYYWDMEHSFKLKQAPGSNKAVIIKIIQTEQKIRDDKNPPSFREITDNNNDDLRSEVIRSSIKPQVLKFLLTDMPNLYIRQKGTNQIKLKTSLISFLKDHRVIIKNGLNYNLTKYLEKINKSIPQIAAKLDHENYPSRNLYVGSANVLDHEQNNYCFYCDRRYDSSKKRHIDHVIPFNYIFGTEAYNCVAACVSCNLAKSDLLPRKNYFDNVLVRNDKFTKEIKALPSSMKKSFSIYDKIWYERTYHNCIDDYNGDYLFFVPSQYVV